MLARKIDLALLGALYAAEFAAILVSLAVHKLGDIPFSADLLTTAGLAFVAGTTLLVLTLGFIVRACIRRRSTWFSSCALAIATNLATLALVLIPSEIALRVLSRHSRDVPVVLDTVLLPRNWNMAVTHYSQVLDQPRGELSYLTHDDVLGWTVAPNRRSTNGLYFSSAEGLRAAAPGIVLSTPVHARRRIALVGDSYTCAEGVRFEASWGYMLERSLRGDFQVLNFAVPGYGVDQAYFRFKKDVLVWKPELVILAFRTHGLYRTMTVYPFINWPEWDMPFSKPRLVLDKDAFRTLNTPALPPSKMFSMQSVSDLPFLTYDQGYKRSDWQEDVLDLFYVKRWLLARFPRWQAQSASLNEDGVRLNDAVLREFVRLATEHGIKPVIAYLPGEGELRRYAHGAEREMHRVLKPGKFPAVDATPCVAEIGGNAAYLPGDPHYSEHGNAAVAKCIAAALQPMLQAGQALNADPQRPAGSVVDTAKTVSTRKPAHSAGARE
jgi:hypothetical protein